jgi:transcriptional regulator with PAS, ATPase and Fis domain
MIAGSETGGLLEHLVSEIAQAVSGETGDAFFRELVRDLGRALGADCVLIGALQPEGERVQTLAAWAEGAEAPPFSYALAGTPCANVVEKRLCSYPTGVQSLFPQDTLLAKMGADGYVGSPLIDSAGRCLGLIAAITRRPLDSVPLTEGLLRIFAVRAATELDRQNYEDTLKNSEQRLRTLLAHSKEAIVRVDLRQPIPPGLGEAEFLDHAYKYGYVGDCNEQAARLFGRSTPAELIGAPLEVVAPRGDPEQLERLRVGIRDQWRLSQVERTLAGRSLLMTREGVFEDGMLAGAWVTARDVTELKQAEAEVRRLNHELERRVAELDQLKAQLEQENAYLLDEIRAQHNCGEMIGGSPRFLALIERIRLVAPTTATVLITGETGTGKELVARAIHNLSPRRDRPLVKTNCAALSPSLVESELFGHVKGAFTGATERRTGRFEHAHGGTLFLDEISELPLESQAKLLRVLQEQEFEPVGSNRSVKVDVRVLAATNRNLEAAVAAGRFRADLYYRLLVVPIEVPPLRERREDVPALVAHFAARLGRQLGRRVDRVSEAAMRRLVSYSWPGNIRELENFLARAIVLSPGELDVSLLAPGPEREDAAARSLEEVECRHIRGVLASTGWVVEGRHGAAGVLKVNPSTLRSRMKRLGIQRP